MAPCFSAARVCPCPGFESRGIPWRESTTVDYLASRNVRPWSRARAFHVYVKVVKRINKFLQCNEEHGRGEVPSCYNPACARWALAPSSRVARGSNYRCAGSVKAFFHYGYDAEGIYRALPIARDFYRERRAA